MMQEPCTKCINGWIEVAENTFNVCDCPAGQKLRRFTDVVDIARAHDETFLNQVIAWYKRKMGRVT